MDRLTTDLDRQLGEWLRDESATRAPAGLVEAVFDRTSGTRQARRWWPMPSPDRQLGPRLVGAGRPSASWGRTVLAGAAVVLVVAILGFTLRPVIPGPGGRSPSPSPTPVVTPSSAPSPPAPTPSATSLDGVTAQVLSLGSGAGPIAVIEAFDSIWTANIFGNSVSRIDPVSFREIARIPVQGGPAWFAVAEGALWVTNQLGGGLTRIDPATSTVAGRVDGPATCGAPVVALDSIWQAACDANQVLRIDPATNLVVETLPASDHTGLVLIGTDIFASGPNGLARLDPDTGVFTDVGGCCGFAIASDGQTAWLLDESNLVRVDAAGNIVATFELDGAKAVAFGVGHAWVTVSNVGVLEIDLETNDIVRTIPLLPSPHVPFETDGVLWVTDFDRSELWRLDL